jgi:ribonuclease HI
MKQPLSSSRLFPESPATPPSGVHTANIDGASRGNPGPAAYAVIVKDPAGKVIFQLGKKLGRETNNVAEYYALLAALDYATSHGLKALRIRSDSQLLVRQMLGRYKVKSPDLKPLAERALKLARQLEYFVIEHVRREMNRDADALANVALDGASSSDPINCDTETRKEGRKPPSKASAASESSSQASRTIRARFVRGVLVPSEPLNVPEGSDVLLTLRNR